MGLAAQRQAQLCAAGGRRRPPAPAPPTPRASLTDRVKVVRHPGLQVLRYRCPAQVVDVQAYRMHRLLRLRGQKGAQPGLGSGSALSHLSSRQPLLPSSPAAAGAPRHCPPHPAARSLPTHPALLSAQAVGRKLGQLRNAVPHCEVSVKPQQAVCPLGGRTRRCGTRRAGNTGVSLRRGRWGGGVAAASTAQPSSIPAVAVAPPSPSLHAGRTHVQQHGAGGGGRAVHRVAHGSLHAGRGAPALGAQHVAADLDTAAQRHLRVAIRVGVGVGLGGAERGLAAPPPACKP